MPNEMNKDNIDRTVTAATKICAFIVSNTDGPPMAIVATLHALTAIIESQGEGMSKADMARIYARLIRMLEEAQTRYV